MIKSERIPYKVKMKLRAVLLDGETDEAVAIAAAINTWPGMECRPTFTPSRIILPLTQEPST